VSIQYDYSVFDNVRSDKYCHQTGRVKAHGTPSDGFIWKRYAKHAFLGQWMRASELKESWRVEHVVQSDMDQGSMSAGGGLTAIVSGRSGQGQLTGNTGPSIHWLHQMRQLRDAVASIPSLWLQEGIGASSRDRQMW
jgi:hypothetical protein